LNPGGVVTAFVQLYETTESAVKSELATFFTVFPNGALFANTIEGTGYDAVLFARAGDEPIDVDAAAARLRATAYGRVAESLREVGFASTADLFGTYAGGASELTHWLADAELNTDRNLRLQYLAGEGLNLNVAAAIFANVGASSRADFPRGLFAGSVRELEAIRRRLQAAAGSY
jgi:spermidine synthase